MTVRFTGYGNVDLNAEIRFPPGADCAVVSTLRNSSLTGIEWETLWKKVPFKEIDAFKASKASLKGLGAKTISDSYDLLSCQFGYRYNECQAPSVCHAVIDSCSAEDLTLLAGYAPLLSVKALGRKRFLVKVEAEQATFSACADSILNNPVLQDSLLGTSLIVKQANREGKISVPFDLEGAIDCTQPGSGFQYACEMKPRLLGRVVITGPVALAR